jgi:hypothetical protein
MKAVCPICNKAFELTTVRFEESSNVVKGQGESFCLIPEHVGIEGKDTGRLVDASTGNLIKTFCDGSFRPPLKENSVH